MEDIPFDDTFEDLFSTYETSSGELCGSRNIAPCSKPFGSSEKAEAMEIEPTNAKKKAGRRYTEGTLLLRGVKTKLGEPLKKEYKRCQVIRLIKKILRQLKKENFTTKISHIVEFVNHWEPMLVRKMREVYVENESFFSMISPTVAGPYTDGKVYRSHRAQATAASFNNQFCTTFFSPLCVREFLSLLIKLVYGPEDRIDPALLCSRLNEYCCQSSSHTGECVEAWRKVRKFVAEVMLEELGLQPFVEEGEFYEELTL